MICEDKETIFFIEIHNEDFLGKRRTFFFSSPLDEQFVHLVVSLAGFRRRILSASAFNSCMIEFSITDFNETIIKNIISLFLSFSNTERREVIFRTQWFIG